MIISSIKSGDGKTMLTSCIGNILLKIGIITINFKIGPDYIDSIYNGYFNENLRLNIFLWENKILSILKLIKFVLNKKLIIEDSMGIYDRLYDNNLSIIKLSEIIKLKLFLIINCNNSIQTVIELSKNILNLLSGVILNNIKSYKHQLLITTVLNKVMKNYDKILFGIIYHFNFKLFERYLGLKQIFEYNFNPENLLNKVSNFVYFSCNINKIKNYVYNKYCKGHGF